MKIEAPVPRALVPLLQPARYKGAYGGRGGGKSHFFAEQIILRCLRQETHVVCIREVQISIRESVYKLLVEKIQKLGVEHQFHVLEKEIRGRNGSLIIFRGMQTMNAVNIKSLEGYDVAWIEEAQSLSEKSFRMLRPTLRKPGSEIWASWNPQHDTDAVDVFFRGAHKHPRAVCVNVNYQDNPWPSQELDEERERDFRENPEMAEHVWNGGYEVITEGAYYAKWILKAEQEGRIGDFPPNPHLAVATSWDIGVRDYTSVWFFQDFGHSVRVVDFYETSGDGADEIVSTALPEYLPDEAARYRALADLCRDRSFRYDDHWLPHDIKVREWGRGARARTETLIDLGFKPESIKVGVASDPADRVNAVRRLLPSVYFNDTPRVQQGIKRLRRYSRKWNEQLARYEGPLKDGNDHAADAFGEYAINAPMIAPKPPEPKRTPTPQELARIRLPGPPEPRTRRRIEI